jgi:nucleotide-binding universal stress UspA family protein
MELFLKVSNHLREDKEPHKRQLEALVGRYSSEDVNQKVHLVKGKAESLIPKTAREKHVDLIVMGTVCRTGIPGFFMGTTAERTLQHVDCSVLTVKPKGFVSLVGHHDSVPY